MIRRSGQPRRAAAAVTFAIILWSSGLPVPQSAMAATYGDCDNSGLNYPSKIGMARMQRTAGTYDGIIGDQIVRSLHSCSNPNGPSTIGESWALLTLQNATGSRFIQLGYGHADCPTGSTCGVDDNVLHFVFTRRSDTGGVLDDFDALFFEQPQPGDKYRFKLFESGSSESWQYCIKNVTDGGGYSCLVFDQDFVVGEEVYWNFEVSQIEDQMGSPSPAGTALAKWNSMQYLHDTSTIWIITTGDSGNCNAAPGGALDCDTELGEPALFSRHHATVGHLTAAPPDDESYLWAYSTNDQ